MLSKGLYKMKNFYKITIRTHYSCYTIFRDIRESNTNTKKRLYTYEKNQL